MDSKHLFIYVVNLVLLINVIPPTIDCYKNEFKGTVFDNIDDISKVISHINDISSFLQTFQENHVMGNERLLSALSRKDLDQTRTCSQLIESRGYKSETHYVVTSSGYILTIFRIVHPNSPPNGQLPRPFLLLPSIYFSCSGFLINQEGKNGSLGYFLAENGQDVWLANWSGSSYGQNHTYLKPTYGSPFWDITLETMATKDFPALVEYVQKATGHDKIRLYSHSFGTMPVLIQLSLNPSFSFKFEINFLAAPTGYLGQIDSSVSLAPRNPHVLDIISSIRAPFPPLISVGDPLYVLTLCTYTVSLPICLELMNSIGGFNTFQITTGRLSVYISQIDSTSFEVVGDILYTMNVDHLRPNTHGLGKSLFSFGTPLPPIYPFENIITDNIVIFSSENDRIAVQQNVQKLRNSVKERFLVDHIVRDPLWAHFDYLFGRQADLYVNEILLDITNIYANNPIDGRLRKYNNADNFTSSSSSASAASSTSSANSG